MLKRTLSTLALLTVTAPAFALIAAAQSTATVRLAMQPESKLWIEGSSNLHGWSCATQQFDATIDVDPAITGTAPSAVPHLLQKVEVRVPVRSLKCGHGGMDNNLYKALKADDAGTISYILGSFTATPGADANRFAVKAVGNLTIAGTEKSVTLEMSADKQSDGSLRVQGSVPLLMTDFGIKPPTAILGTLKTGNQVLVKFDLRVTPQTAVAEK